RHTRSDRDWSSDVCSSDLGEVITDAYIWPRVLQAQLSRNVGTGKFVLGRLGQGTAKPGQNAPWKLTDATGTDQQVAQKYLDGLEIGRASCRERVWSAVGAG